MIGKQIICAHNVTGHYETTNMAVLKILQNPFHEKQKNIFE